MNKSYVVLILVLLLATAGLKAGAAEAVPTIQLGPGDIVQDSIKQVHWSTNLFAVKWSYTESGAKRMVDFWGQHPGKKVCIQVGKFTTPPFVAPGPEDPVTHEDWRPGWLQRHTDRFLNITEKDAKTIVAGMTGR